jgi:predicted site-specific integrase-resolvase
MQMAWMRPQTLAEQCDVALSTVQQWMKQGLPHSRISKRIILIKDSDFDYWLRRMQRKTQAPVPPIVEKLSRDLDQFLGRS